MIESMVPRLAQAPPRATHTLRMAHDAPATPTAWQRIARWWAARATARAACQECGC